jgi:hypothetical protein
VLRRVTSGAFRYSSANSRARVSALPFGTTSATTPHSCAVCAWQRLWVQQERLRSPRSRAITPGGKDSVTGCNACGEVGHILQGRTRFHLAAWTFAGEGNRVAVVMVEVRASGWAPYC